MTSYSDCKSGGETDNNMFPVLAERLDEINAELLKESIFASDETKISKAAQYERIVSTRKQTQGGKTTFQVATDESPFSAYSSKGWKIHVPFEKGQERLVGGYLFANGLYFKVESGIGTYFNGNMESGATIYIGSYDAMQAVKDVVGILTPILTDGAVATYQDGRKLHIGSGSDIEVQNSITARFDVAKTEYGIKGTGKYDEDGLPSWTGLGGIPLLRKDIPIVNHLENRWNYLSKDDRIDANASFRYFHENARQELIRDFGEEFVFGHKC